MEPRPPVALVLMKLSNTTSNRSVIWNIGGEGGDSWGSDPHFYTFKLQTWSTHLAKAPPDLGLDGGIHLLLINRHGDQFVQNGSDALALGVVIVLAEADKVEQPGCHVLQTEVLQLNAYNMDNTDFFEPSFLFIILMFSQDPPRNILTLKCHPGEI